MRGTTSVPPVLCCLHGYPACLEEALLLYTDQRLHFGGLHTIVACVSPAQQLLLAPRTSSQAITREISKQCLTSTLFWKWL